MAENDPLWFKDAVFYQLHIKAFYDSDNDGIGDFRGLTQKLDYIQHLGVDTLWLLPFYPSPLKDDGYDIADYRNVHPSYGSMRDFRQFVREAHDRGLKVITELVINHTSDQHPWFQRARSAKPGTRARDYYVWSQTHQKYQGTRIIFTDTEKSNWAWDDGAQAYYWHRFFSHQPDLNFDNPMVVREVISVMRYWLDIGVDGMRLDAVPYLCEREGTNNENLPETHGVLKQLRAAMDNSHPNRIFLAEANQWPEDVLPYFGDNDECHMAFHFPLMPRMYMAVAREDRHPITDIMRQTPDIPSNCQWAVFLRNHDELTLEMVTNRERDYLWTTYAADLRARVNVGIRRRLAPLMDNDRRKIELLNSLLLSMPGTPIIYYGDEIGMGDNIYLGDRNGVRTPMQWSEDRNGGFSRVDPAKLYLPVIMDPVYGYRSVNVEAQIRSPSSLLNWMRRLIEVRRSRKVFGRGSLRFLYPSNRKILAYIRDYEGETVLCVANLARSAQGVELHLGEFKDRVPIELMGRTTFPPIGELPYFLTLPGYSFYWFLLAAEAEVPSWHEHYAPPLPELFTLVLRNGWADLLSSGNRRLLEQETLPNFLRNQRWFAEKDSKIDSVEVLRWGEFRGESASGAVASWMIPLVAVRRSDGGLRHYHVPLAQSWPENEEMPLHALARLRRGPQVGALVDAAADDAFVLALLEAVRENRVLPGSDGNILCFPTRALTDLAIPDNPAVRRLGAEQSNTSIIVGEQVVIKLIRRVEAGTNPEVEMGRFLTETAHFANTPPLLGGMATIDGTGQQTVLAMLHGYVANQGDAWAWITSYLERFLDDRSLMPPDEVEQGLDNAHRDMIEFVRTIGQRTAELHKALCADGPDPDFEPMPITGEDLSDWRRRAFDQAQMAFTCLEKADFEEAAWLRDHASDLLDWIDAVPDHIDAVKIRLHGDYHLGQLLVVKNDVFIVDFEGEPARALEGRRGKDAALRDVAGMMRSFDYAAWTTMRRVGDMRPGTAEILGRLARDWQDRMSRAFLDSYLAAIKGCRACPTERDQVMALLHLFLMEKACYEICYEAANRPAWLAVPVKGVMSLLRAEEKQADGQDR